MADPRISPFFQSLNSSIDAIVPLAMEKFKLDQSAQRWKDQLAETTRAHNISLGTNMLQNYYKTGDANNLNTAKTLLSSAVGDSVPGFEIGETLPADTQTKLDKAQRLKNFIAKVRGGTPVDLTKYNTPGWTKEQLDAGMRAFEPEEILNMYATEMPEDVKDVMTMRHQLKSDDLNDLYKKSLIDYHDTLGEAAKTRANKTGEGTGKVKVTGNVGINPKTGKEEYLMTDGSFSGVVPGAKPKAAKTGGLASLETGGAGEKMLDAATAKSILDEAGGDTEKARKIARDRGYKF